MKCLVWRGLEHSIFRLVAGLPSPPAYPFYAGSTYPLRPEASMQEPGWELHAKSEEFASEATATPE